ncbi:MAG: PD40 domain-containing protein, partial [Actinobacteria bacterium]|nr:PD40 domain-containing protein [Actinomycetota bacterium]
MKIIKKSKALKSITAVSIIIFMFFLLSSCSREKPEQPDATAESIQAGISKDQQPQSSTEMSSQESESIQENKNLYSSYAAIEVSAADGVNSYIIFIDNTSTQFVTIADSLSSNSGPSISPDGKTVAFYSNRDGDYDIFTVRSDGTEIKNITSNDSG